MILDHLTEEGRKTRNEMWLPVEKLGSSAPKLGRIKHEYEVEGDAVTVDRFIYLSGDTACEDSRAVRRLSRWPGMTAVAYRIRIE